MPHLRATTSRGSGNSHLTMLLSRRRRKRPPLCSCLALATYLVFISDTATAFPNQPADAGHITANAGQTIIFNCDVDFPDGQPVPYVVQWWKKGKDLPIYIWYDNYPTHTDKDYTGRVAKVEPDQATKAIDEYSMHPRRKEEYGLASLNLTSVVEKDRGWYNCRVLFFDRNPSTAKNGTWYHLDVHAPPYFINTPKDIEYVSLHESIILNCEAGGTPTPEIVWFKGKGLINISDRVGVFNDGTELRISNVLHHDLGDYTCVARNGVGNEGRDRIQFTTNVVMAGGAVITKRPKNMTVLQGQGAEMDCEGEANPGNVSIRWYKNGSPIKQITGLDRRTSIKPNGTLVFHKIEAEDEGQYTCEVTNGIGKPISVSAHLVVEYRARVSFHQTVQYIPRGMQGIVKCHIEANPPIQFVTWTKNKRIFDPFVEPGVMAIENGSIIIDKVGPEHVGDYVCTPYNIHGSDGPSKVMHVKIKNPPEVTRRPDQEYHKSVGDKVTMPCGAIGSPTPSITWRRVDGQILPRNRHQIYNGELTMDSLRKADHGVYECVVHNEVATIVVRTELFIERTTPHAPTNLTVTSSETFSVTIQWLPGYSGCASCKQTYKIRYREKDSKFPNWIELPVNPPDARKIQIHHLNPRTKYEFQVIGTNEFGDGMYSEIIEAQTKADGGLEWSVYAPTASPSEQSTGNSDYASFNIDLLPTDSLGDYIYPQIAKEKDIPPGEAPGPATNLTLTQEAGGWVLRWLGPPDESKLIYYTVQIKEDSDGQKWMPLTASKIDVEEASYMIKNMGTAKAYLFRVFSHSPTTYSISEELKYDLPENVKRRAVTAGLIGGILFFIVAIVLSVCTVKICNKRRRRKQERAYNMVACRLSEARNGGHISQVPLKRHGKRRVPAMKMSNSSHGILAVFDQVTDCINSVEDRVEQLTRTSQWDKGDEPDYGDGRRRDRLPLRKKNAKYSVHLEYPTQPGHRGLISRSKDGKFILDNDEDDEGGFGTELPPNRFRTRSVAIIAGYSPERLYSNMPPGAFVVESGMYKVGADREWERPEPMYWRQLVYSPADGTGTLNRSRIPMAAPQQPPRPSKQVSRLGEEDMQRLQTMGHQHQQPSVTSLGTNFSQSRLIRTSNLELLQPETAAKMRASSPLNQQVPLVEWMSPIHNYSDLSSVSHRERSLPSTLLTSPSTFETNTNTNTASSRSLKGVSQRSSELHTIPEALPDGGEEGPPGYQASQGLSVIQADVHHHQQQQPGLEPRSRGNRKRPWKQEEDPYFQRTTYRNADSMFPNYALNYPAPIHLHQRIQGTISPSRQYPPVQIPPSSYWRSLYVQPDPRDFAQDPLATSSPPPLLSPRASIHDYENMPYRSHQPRPRPRPQLPAEPTVIEGRPLHQAGLVRASRVAAGGEDEVSLVSEVLDAEVTALTNSSSPGSAQGSDHKTFSKERLKDVMGEVKRKLGVHSSPEELQQSSSSGIASKNTSSQNQTTSSSSTSGSQSQFLSPESKEPLEPIFEACHQPFYENWPPPKPAAYPPPPPVKPKSTYFGVHYMQPLSIVPPTTDDLGSHVPPLTPHQSLGLTAKPQASRGIDRRLEGLSPHDTSLDTPPSRLGSRPGSAHSAPLLDVSIDRHYEFDTRTPTEDLNLKSIREALPAQWNRPYLGYNPRQRDREMGAAAQLAKTERVFSDSEIYSPVFPRGRPDPKVEDVSARVQAMKREFQEYREQQQKQQEQQRSSSNNSSKGSPPGSPLKKTSTSSPSSPSLSKADSTSAEAAPDRLESLI